MKNQADTKWRRKPAIVAVALLTLAVVGAAQAALPYRLITRRASLGRSLKATASHPTFTGSSVVGALANRTLRVAAERGLQRFRAEGRRALREQPS